MHISEGVNCYNGQMTTFTTPSNCYFIYTRGFRSDGPHTVLNNGFNFIIVEGELNEPLKYFEGIKSFGETEQKEDKYKISILSHNKNMFDCTKLINYGKQYDLNILDAKNNIFTIKNHQNIDIDLLSIMNVNKNKLPISISFSNEIVTGGDAYLRAFYKDGTNKYIGNVSGGYITFKISKAIDKLVFSYNTSGTNKFSNVQIEYGENSTSYQQPKYNKKDILIKEPLRKGDYIYKDNEKIKIYRNVNQYTFTGNEENIIKSNTYGDVIRFDYKIKNIKRSGDIICNNFSKGIISTNNLECINVHAMDNLVQFQIKANKISPQDVNGFKS